MIIGGYSFILNDGGSALTDNSIPNELGDSSKDNISLDNNTRVSDGNSNIKVVKNIFDNDLKELTSSFNSIQFGVIEDSDVPSQIFAFSGNVAYLNFPQNNQSSNPNPSFELKDVNKSEYILSPNYDKHIYIKIGQDFTDLFVQCVNGDFIPLGNITRQLPQMWVCDLSCGAGDAYFDLNNPHVDYRNYDEVMYYIEHDEYPTNNQQIDDAIPIYSNEQGYAADHVDESNDVNSINEELPQENVVVENPQIEVDSIA